MKRPDIARIAEAVRVAGPIVSEASRMLNARAQGAIAERKRVSDIMTAPPARGLETLAAHLATSTDLPVAQAVRVLELVGDRPAAMTEAAQRNIIASPELDAFLKSLPR